MSRLDRTAHVSSAPEGTQRPRLTGDLTERDVQDQAAQGLHTFGRCESPVIGSFGGTPVRLHDDDASGGRPERSGIMDERRVPRIDVRIAGDGTPYFMVKPEQLDGVLRLLEAHGVKYRMEQAVHDDGQPLALFVNLERGADAPEVQRLLNEATG